MDMDRKQAEEAVVNEARTAVLDKDWTTVERIMGRLRAEDVSIEALVVRAVSEAAGKAKEIELTMAADFAIQRGKIRAMQRTKQKGA